MADITGARLLIDTLLELGVDTVFGYPGGTVLPIYDELYRVRNKIRHILTSHEQGAAHAADGYARASGRVGVCIATSGPGATNLTTGIATAYMDSSPVVFITGNVPSEQIGTDSFQEVDIIGITMPITRYNYFVSDVGKLRDTLHKAFALALNGRPGPVLVDVPKNTQTAYIESPCFGGTVVGCDSLLPVDERVDAFVNRNKGAFEKALDMISQSERPFMLLGGGVSRTNASGEIMELAARLNCPVAATLMALGSFPTHHRQYAGNFGMHGMERANTAFNDCDLLIAVGTRFNDRISGEKNSFLNGKKLLQIDIDASEIGKIVPAHNSLIGDAALAIHAVNKCLPARVRGNGWLDSALPEGGDEAPAGRDDALSPRSMMHALRKIMGEEALVATDVGQHQMWAAQYIPFSKPGSFITSGGLGTMGFGLGAAIGMSVARPDVPHALVTGDGSFRMNLTELSTLMAEKIPLAIVLMNNGVLGMVRQWQTLFYGKRYEATDLGRGPDFIKLAGAYGLKAFAPINMGEYEDALKWVVDNRAAVLIDCLIDKDEMVRPMVAPGRPLTDFLLREGRD